ncbi:MAG: metallophosphoesterase family protein [Tepidiformaceae bacterium]
MRIGLITDTHLPSVIRHLDQLGPEIGEFLQTVDLILHGGDVTSPIILDWCEQFAPVLVAQGNNDDFSDPRMKRRQFLEIEGWRIGMVHDLRPEHRPVTELIEKHMEGRELDILIAGDTHVERLEYRDGVVFINSGSPILPHHKETRLGTMGLLELEKDRLHAEIIVLGHTTGTVNPGTHHHLQMELGRVVTASRGGVLIPYGENGAATDSALGI